MHAYMLGDCASNIWSTIKYIYWYVCLAAKHQKKWSEPSGSLYFFPNNAAQSPSMYASTLRKQMNRVFALARNHSLLRHSRQKEIYDRKIHEKPYQKGDYVWLYSLMGKREINK